MHLKCDDLLQIYVWIDPVSGRELSPHFDYEDDALQWHNRRLALGTLPLTDSTESCIVTQSQSGGKTL